MRGIPPKLHASLASLFLSSVLTYLLIGAAVLLTQEIDANISKATDQGYAALITLGSRGFTLATNIVLSTAIKVRRLYFGHLIDFDIVYDKIVCLCFY